MKLSLFDYHLPENLIAQRPARPRDQSRLLVVNRTSGTISHHHFYQLSSFLNKNYVLVFNDTKVFPARILGRKSTGGRIQVLLTGQQEPQTWQVLTSPGLKKGQQLYFFKDNQTYTNHNSNRPGGPLASIARVNHLKIKPVLSAQVIKESDSRGNCFLRFEQKSKQIFKLIQKIGKTPLPPYIKTRILNPKFYQTIYASNTGSCAAPTAGFHFTKNTFKSLKKLKIEHYFITLHVGPGTFLPVTQKNVKNHQMHTENYCVDPKVLQKLKQAKKCGKKILAVGTTTARVLETVAGNEVTCGKTNIFIYPSYKFKFVDALITNFHLPKSTLLMLVSAFVSFPNLPTLPTFRNFQESLIGRAYRYAIDNNYRFYSFGDAMLII